MTKQKQFYVSPETETLVVRFEGVVCSSPLLGNQGTAGADQDYNEYDEDY